MAVAIVILMIMMTQMTKNIQMLRVLGKKLPIYWKKTIFYMTCSLMCRGIISWTAHFCQTFQWCFWRCFWDVLLHLLPDLQNMSWIHSLIRQSKGRSRKKRDYVGFFHFLQVIMLFSGKVRVIFYISLWNICRRDQWKDYCIVMEVNQSLLLLFMTSIFETSIFETNTVKSKWVTCSNSIELNTVFLSQIGLLCDTKHCCWANF